jgi:hypothetical protein
VEIQAVLFRPFAALPDPARMTGGKQHGADSDTGTEYDGATVPMIMNHEIVSLPSASVLDVLRRQTRDRASAPETLAVLADPVFDADDPRVKKSLLNRKSESISPRNPSPVEPVGPLPRSSGPAVSNLQEAISDLHRAEQYSGMLQDESRFPRLPSTKNEAEAILSVVPSNSSMKALGFKACLSKAKSPELSRYRIVHFTTHGILDSENPELSGLVLSRVDEQGRWINGYLRLNDIYNLKLPADLVVLSACNSALGKQVRGEGLLGIVRGFMYAGAERVVASLWNVEDEATAEFMKRFYTHMFEGGKPAAAALQKAQVEMCGQKRWSFPYFWAAFVLQGEWK